MRCLTDLDHSNSKQKLRERDTRALLKYSAELRAQNHNLRRVVGFHYEVAAVVGFHYEIYRPAATQPDWST